MKNTWWYMVRLRLRYIARRVWKLCIAPEEEFRLIGREKKELYKVERRYLYSLISICLICDFLFTILYSEDHGFRYGVGATLLDAASLFIGYQLVKHFAPKWLISYTHKTYEPWSLSTAIMYSFAVLVVVQILTTIFPGLGFLKILDLFVAYLLWVASGELLHLEEDDKATTMVILTLIIYFFPIILSILMHAIFKDFFPRLI